MDRIMQRLFSLICSIILISTSVLFLGCGGDSSSKSTPDVKPAPVYAAPVIDTKASIVSKSGAFTLIEWTVSSEDENTTVEIKQITGAEDISITILDSEKGKAHFNAPIIDVPNTDYQFEIAATNSQGRSTATIITLEVLPVEPVFKQPRNIFDYDTGGSKFSLKNFKKIGEHYIVTLDIEGSSSLTTKAFRWQDGKLKEDNDFDIDPLYLRRDIKYFDINNDGIKDALFIKEVSVEDLCSHAPTRFALLMVKYGTLQGFENETLLTNLACLYVDDFYDIIDVRDVNADGYLDLELRSVVPEISRSFPKFYIHSPETGQYTKLSLNDKGRLVDINGDKLEDQISINDVFDCEVHFATCGTLQYQLQQPELAYGEWTNFDLVSEHTEYYGFKIYDINQDKIDDVTISAAIPLIDPSPTKTHWFELTAKGDFQHHQIGLLPDYYDDLFATGTPYFFDINRTKFVKYQYNSLVHAPVITEVQQFPLIDLFKRFTDIDNDGDLDILTIDNEHILMIENSAIE